MVTSPENKRGHLWFRLNGYGVLIAALEILAAVQWFADPECVSPPCSGFPVVGTFVYGAYALSGILLIASYWLIRVDLEVFASVGLVVANLTQTVRTVWFGDSHFFDIGVSLIVVVVVALRLSALLQGGVFSLPAWRPQINEEEGT